MEYKVNKYKQMILEENTRQNLISRRNPEAEVDKHIYDSLAVLEYFNLSQKNIIDIGSGAGFPGMVLAIKISDCRMTLVEADLKKGAFLKNVKEALNLDNVSVLNQRVEEIGHDKHHRGKYDLCTSRALAPVKVLVEYSLPLIKVKGLAVMWKGRNYAVEISEAEKALRLVGGKVKHTINYNLMEEYDRTLVVVEKTIPTTSQFPRRVGVPAKRPL